MSTLTQHCQQYFTYKYMRLLTLIFGGVLIVSSVVLLSHGYMEAVDFSALVNMNWSTSSAFHSNPISSYIDTMHQTKVYAVVFDAGSTGTRVHVYKFRYLPTTNESFPYMLVDEVYEEIKPGLSSHAAHPEAVRPGLAHLLQLAKRKIPKLLWPRTAMTLRATAGLRLLPAAAAQSLLDEAEAVLASSGLQLMPRGVAIMSGLEEAQWSWLTVNFLLRRVTQPSRSSGIVDLGGGSVQICFVPPQRSLNASGRRQLYSHSYLGLGLMSARHAVLTRSQRPPPQSRISPPQQQVIESRCVPHGYRGHWTFGGVRYAVHSAATANESLFAHCLALSRALVEEHVADHRPPPPAPQRPFYLFSYFYDRAKDAGFTGSPMLQDGLAQPVGDGWIISPGVYAQLAANACLPSSGPAQSQPHKPYRQKPYLCLDLTYIYALLTRGFLFADDSLLHLNKKINNIELGWALGAVFDMLHRTEKM